MTTVNPGDEKTIWINDTNGHAYRDEIDLEKNIQSYTNIYATYVINSQLFNANTETQLTNFTQVSGSLAGMNLTTGVYTPQEEGIYSFGLFVGITSNATRTEVACHVRNDPVNTTRYLNTLLTSDLSQPWEGSVTFCSTNYLDIVDVLNITVQLNLTETCDLILRIIKII